MVRQCAWCLRLINSFGVRTSVLPMPKIYKASHGMCQVCGASWLEAVGDFNSNGGIAALAQSEDERQRIGETMFPATPTSPLPENEGQTLLAKAVISQPGNGEDSSTHTRDDTLCLAI
jgi:hypothetical protein